MTRIERADLPVRAAAGRLVGGDDAITDIALDVGFDDLSNFIRTFRAEFGVSPRTYRGRGARPGVSGRAG